jgi:hypothetical protein
MGKSKVDQSGVPAPEHVTLAGVMSSLQPLGFQRIEHVPKSSYRDNSMVVICPTRGVPVLDENTGEAKRDKNGDIIVQPMIHKRVVEAWQALQWSMNGKRAMFLVTGAEVGKAYTEQIQAVLAHPDLSKWRYVLTLEDDNIPPPDAVTLLLEAIEAGPFDAVGGLYFTKGDLAMPQCYGDAEHYARTGELEFRPRDIVAAVKQGHIVPCNGIAQGCSLYRMSLFKELPPPWFVTTAGSTQDLYFAANACRAGKRFAVDCRVRVGHLDVATGTVY